MDIAKEKQACREDLLACRASLSKTEKAAQSLLLGQNIAAFLDARGLQDDLVIGVYAALPDEINLAPAVALFYEMGATVAFPCAHSAEEMSFFALGAQDFAQGQPAFFEHPGRFISKESCGNYRFIAPEKFDILLVPGVGFDKERNRLGQGAGCYDLYLADITVDCLLIGVCFDIQLVEKLPTEPHDRKMDYILTPTIAF